MARAARLELADLRAMEEQTRREEMRGGKQFYGAGATPSMGVSQFKGGRKSRKVVVMEPEEMDDDDEMRGGNYLVKAAQAALRVATQSGDTVAAAAARRAIRAAQSAANILGVLPEAVGEASSKSSLGSRYLEAVRQMPQFRAPISYRGPKLLTPQASQSSAASDIANFDFAKFNKLNLPKPPSVGQMKLYKDPSSIGQYIDDVPTSITLPTTSTALTTTSTALRPSTVALTRPSSSALARRQSTSALSRPSTAAAARRQSAPALTTPKEIAKTTSKEIAKTSDEAVEVLVQTVGAAATPKMAQTVSALAKSLAKSASSSAVRAGLKKLLAVGIPVAAAAVLIDFLVEKLTVKNRNQYGAEETIDEEEGGEEELRRQIEEEERKREEEERKREEEEKEEEEKDEEYNETVPSEIISSLPPDLSPNELAWYLRSGNLPDRYAYRKPTRARRGNGKCKVGGIGRISAMMRTPVFDRISTPNYGVGKRSAVITPEDAYNSQLISSLFPPKSDGKRSQVITPEDAARSEELDKIRSGQRYREELARREDMIKSIGKNRQVVEEQKPKKAPSASDGRKVRAQIVGKIMRERGVNLAQASKIVKTEGLY